MTRKKNKYGCCQLGFSVQKQQECFSEDHYWFISVDSVGRERSKLFQVVVLILEAAITFFCSNCNDNSVHHSKDAFVKTFKQISWPIT